MTTKSAVVIAPSSRILTTLLLTGVTLGILGGSLSAFVGPITTNSVLAGSEIAGLFAALLIGGTIWFGLNESPRANYRHADDAEGRSLRGQTPACRAAVLALPPSRTQIVNGLVARRRHGKLSRGFTPICRQCL